MPEFSDLSVLIVDPSPGMRGNLHNMLNQASVTRIEYAVSSGTAIRQLGKKPFDLILCEYDLDSGSENGQDGQQLLEDLRHHKLIEPSTIFIMLTSEGVYSKVIGAAELTPTDYVLKPFTVEVLLQRIGRAVERRSVLQRAHRQVANGHLREALRLCVEGRQKTPRYAGDFVRLQAETHAALAEWSDAEMLYRDILAQKALGWAQLGLARCQFAQARHDDARQTLEQMIDTNPRFMAAYDLLARTCEAIGQLEQARKVLEDAVAISPHMVRRLRHLGELAFETGDIGVAERAFRQVVAKAKYSEFRDPQDHVNLVKTLVRKGDATQAGGVIRDLERSLRGGPNTDVCRAIASALVQDMAGNATGAAAELARAAGAVGATQGLSARTKLDLVQACLDHQMDAEASNVVLNMMNDGAHALTMEQATDVFEKAGRHDLAVGVGEQVNQQVGALVSDAEAQLERGDHRGAVVTITAALRRTPANVHVLVAALRTILRQLDELGWEAPLAEQASHLLARLRTLDAVNPALEALTLQYVGTQRKYGIAAAA